MHRTQIAVGISLALSMLAVAGVALCINMSARSAASAAVREAQTGRWTIAGSPNAGGSNVFAGVAGIDANDAWAIGTSDVTIAGGRTLIAHWDGQDWSIVPSPNAGSDPNFLGAVAAVSSKDAWAVGRYYHGPNQLTLIERWDGTGWKRVISPNPAPGVGANALSGIAAISANDIWAVGGYNVGDYRDKNLTMHWNGRLWQIVYSPNAPGSNYLKAVAGSSGEDVWAVGFSAADQQMMQHRPLALRWDGSRWERASIPHPPGASAAVLNGVSVANSNDAWAVGRYYKDGAHHTLVERWNGSAWKMVPGYDEPGATYSELHSVWASGGNVWAVGGYSLEPDLSAEGMAPSLAAPGMQALIVRWNGTAWDKVDSPNPGEGSKLTALTASGGSMWAVGSYYAGDDLVQTLVERLVP
jgi:hypothetical protein